MSLADSPETFGKTEKKRGRAQPEAQRGAPLPQTNPELAALVAPGLAPPQEPTRKTALSQTGDTESGAVGEPTTPIGKLATLSDPDFQTLVTAWPKLPARVRRGILALIQATQDA